MAGQKGINTETRIDRVLTLVALALMAVAWFWGRSRSDIDLTPFLQKTFDEAGHFEHITNSIYSVWRSDRKDELLGYLAAGNGSGFGGDMTLMVAVSGKGEVINATLVDHKETPSFLKRVVEADLFASLKGKTYKDAFKLRQDIDGISGATYTCRAVAASVRRASRKVADKVLGLPVPAEEKPVIQFGFAEIFLLILFVLSFLTSRPFFKYKQASRWIIMVSGLAVLGFALNKPVNLIFINRILLGFLPSWQSYLYWYLLLAGILFFLIIDNKHLYCERMCPFGAAQECIGLIGGAKPARAPVKIQPFFRWFQRGLALIVILTALVFANPSTFSYEISGALFHLIGSSLQFAILGLILIFALFIKRPWCNYLCPVRPTFEFIRLLRNWINELWHKVRLKSPNNR